MIYAKITDALLGASAAWVFTSWLALTSTFQVRVRLCVLTDCQ
jgi:hypothetical protein